MVETASSPSAVTHARFVARCHGVEAAQRVAAEAFDAGAEGIEEREADGVTELFIYAPTAAAAAVRAAVAALAADASATEVEPVLGQDWSEAWKDGLTAIEISERLVVRPSFVAQQLKPGQQELVIDPAQAFGTGGHASTALALEWIDALAAELPAGVSVLDIGTGTGVLALAAIRLAAARVVALDLDPLAATAARDNALANGISSGLNLFVGGVEAIGDVAFDLVVANLLKTEMLPLAGAIAAFTRAGGQLVLSGLLTQDVEAVEHAFAAVGFARAGSRTGTDAHGECWEALLMRR